MLSRPEFPKQKPVMVINDIPVKKEAELGETFSAISNLNFLSSLRTGRVHRGVESPKSFVGIVSTKIYTTYLDTLPFTEGNFDFKTDFCKRKDLQVMVRDNEEYFVKKEVFPQTETHIIKEICFVQLPHQKDTWISVRLWGELCKLLQEIQTVKPKLIITTGKWTTFLLCGVSSVAENMPSGGKLKPLGCISKFRSSVMQLAECWGISDTIVVPVIHPVHAYSMPDKVPVMEADLQKVGWMYEVLQTQPVDYFSQPKKEFLIGTDVETIHNYLNILQEVLDKEPTKVTIDIETRFHSTIDCIGLTHATNTGLCIPFMCIEDPTPWSIEEEIDIMLHLFKLLKHPNARWVLQNGSYDISYIWELWKLDFPIAEDTMVKAHCLFNYLPKDLAFLASIYCDSYVFWKDEI